MITHYRFLFLCSMALAAPLVLAVPQPLTEEQEILYRKMLEPGSSPRIARDLTAEEIEAKEKHLIKFSDTSHWEKEAEKFEQSGQEMDDYMNERWRDLLSRTETTDLAASFMTVSITTPETENTSNSSTPSGWEEFSLEQSKPDSELTVVHADDGMYFDSEQSLVVYLKNVRMKDPRFTMRCDNQLNIYLEKDLEAEKAAEEKAKADAEKQEETEGEEKKKVEIKVPEFDKLKYEGIRYMSATGNVVITRMNKKGEIQGAEGQEFLYDGKTGDILISGPGKKVLVSAGNRFETDDPDGYVRMLGDGSVYIKAKKTETKLDTQKKEGDKSPFPQMNKKK